MKARPYRLALGLVCLLVLVGGAVPAAADTTAQPLPFAQDWSNIGLITVNDDWSGVPGVIGYRGDGLTSTNDVNAQTVTAEGTPVVVDVNANQTNPNTFSTGGVTEFLLADPVVALTGSGTADAPHIVLSVNTVGQSSVTVAYNLRDLDGSVDDAVQQVALQYRVGSSGNYTNIPAGYVADATTGPSLATLVTPVSVLLPAAADNQPVVQIRIITTNATGNDEWVGIDDISVSSSVVPPADDAPAVESTSPANGATEVPTTANVEITFSEPVTTSAAAFSIACPLGSGTHTFALSGGPTTYTLNPNSDFAHGEVCTIRVENDGVSDVDGDDPPDNMAADYTFTFSTVGVSARIYQIQGAAHISPFAGQLVSGVPGVITAVRPNSLYIQDAVGDGNVATSDGILVFRSGIGAGFEPGDAVLVSGRVTEFRPGGAASTNLTTTEITSPTVTPAGPGAIAPTVVGQGGRVPPTSVIEDDATGSVETSGIFDPETDGIDFYESMEAMLLQVNDAVVTGPRNDFGEVWVLADDGAAAFLRTTREGIVIRATDFNPERIQLEDDIVFGATPAVNVGDHFTSPAVGVLEYNFGNFEVMLTSALTRVDGGLVREVTADPKKHELSVATFNVENLDPLDGPAKFAELAELIVENLRSPAIVALEEIQDNNGPVNDSSPDATLTYQTLIAAIQDAGGPTYDFRQVDPVDDQDGGEPGGNIRVGFIFRTDVEDLTFVDRPGGTSTTANAVVETEHGAQLLYSPGRIDPTNPAFSNSRKPLAGEFIYRHRRVILIANHFNSKGGDQPLFGRFQPPTRSSEVQRHQQAQIVNDFVDQILAAEPKANVVVLGDLNDFEFSTTLDLLEGGVLTTLIETLPPSERYTYVFEGNSQSLDHILVSQELAKHQPGYDVVHVNAEFAQQASDHDPQVTRLDVHGPAVP